MQTFSPCPRPRGPVASGGPPATPPARQPPAPPCGARWLTAPAPATRGSPVCPNTAYDMGTALRRNPFCRVLFFGGIHDAATPFWNVKHSISKMFLPESITSRIEYNVHENWHMAYEDLPTLEKMAPELAAFYE